MSGGKPFNIPKESASKNIIDLEASCNIENTISQRFNLFLFRSPYGFGYSRDKIVIFVQLRRIKALQADLKIAQAFSYLGEPLVSSLLEWGGDKPLNNLSDSVAGARNERGGRTRVDRRSCDVVGA